MKTITPIITKMIMAIAVLLITFLSHSQSQSYTTAGTYTWYAPVGVTSVTVQAWGAGGKGGSRNSTFVTGGGGGGAYARTITIPVAQSVAYTVVVGKGSNSNTTSGGDSTFSDPFIVLTSANGGSSAGSNSLIGANGGSTLASIGDTVFSGGAGANGAPNNTNGDSGGGGSSARPTANGVNATGIAGAISPAGGGSGGNGMGVSNGPGLNGIFPGGGGGGAFRQGGIAQNGGNGADGQVIIAYNCPAITLTGSSQNGPFCGSSSAQITLSSSSFILGSYTVTYDLSGATTATGITAPLTNILGGGTFNTASLAVGTTIVTVTTISSGSCNKTITANNTTSVTVNAPATAAAGVALATCASAGPINVTAGSSASNYSSINWSTSGTGTFTNPTSLTTCTYNPSASDKTAGNVTLTLTAFANTPCGNVASSKTLTISPTVTVVAGTPITTCAGLGAVNITAGSSASNYSSLTWSSSGTGVFVNPTSLTTCTYNPSAADISAGSVIITLTGSNVGCVNITSSKTLTINALPTAVSGPAMFTCSTAGAVNITGGSSATSQSSVTWTSTGTGTFVNANSITTCTYTPSAADISAGTVTLKLTAYGNAPCGNVVSTKTLTINVSPTVTGTTPGFRTGVGTVVLGATSSTGALKWFAALTGGASLGTGTTFTTPIISTTTTFYVESNNGTCASNPRTPVVATVNYPEIDIKGNATSIVSGDTTPSLTDWTDFGTTNATRTFTIRNIGSALLTVGAITISGTNASEFSVTAAPASAVGIGSATTFTVTFAPTVVGLRNATISIVNNDTDENPYIFDVQGTAVAQEIDIQGNATSIVNGDVTPSTTDWTDFSNVAGTRTFTIFNTGNIALNIGAITISGTNPGDFTVTTAPSATVGSNSTTTFVVTFAPTAINTRSAIISIANNDSDENPYVFAIKGFGIIPEIDIQGNATSIPDSTVPAATTSNWTDFSSTAGTRTFTIFNNGNIALTTGAVTFTGTNASDFTLIAPPSSSIAAFSSTSFTVKFLPTALGIRTAQIHIVNNDGDENPYDFNLAGTGVPREIDVLGLGLSIASGDMVTSISDGTDFGPADINLATVTRTFTIQNTGTLALSISNPTISGVNASEFSITTNPSTLSIGAGAGATFSVTFNPSAVFTRAALITIVNNDSDENPYTFAIQGTGLMDNDGDGIENNIDKDDDNDGILDVIECGTCVSNPFVNGSFEAPAIGASTYSIVPSANVPGWTNSAENFIEIWSNGFNGVPAAAGNQFAELNANVAGNLYQTFCLNGAGGSISWAIKHRGRSGTDVAQVRFGASLASLTTVATMSDGNTSWGSYSGNYSIPVGQTSIVLAFTAISSTGGLSYGNFIDDVQIIINQNCVDTDGDGIPDILDVDSDNDGIPDIEEAGFKAYSNNTGTMDKTNPANWKDVDGNGVNDYIDAMIASGTYAIPDTDGDGVPNHLDLDSDNDSIFDVDEAGLLNGDGDVTGDGKGDGLDAEGDGLLDLFDNSPAFGSAFRPYAQDSDLNGIPDYLQLDANDDGINDIQTGLYGSLDANGDGRIDGSADIDRDGITDTFDTNTILRGSPRDLNRKLYLDFDGRNDYAQGTGVLSGLANVSMMAWIDLNPGFSTTGVVVGQDKFQLRINSARKLELSMNGSTTVYNTALTTSRWYHVGVTLGNGNVKIFLNGTNVLSASEAAAIGSDASLLTLGKNPVAANNYFKGKIDEVRIFNKDLTDAQFQRMVYQEIQNNASQVRGLIVPKDVGALPWANLIRYYRMDAYKDDIIDDLTTPAIDVVTGMKIFNHKIIKVQQAPMPFITERPGSFATAANSPTNDVRGMDVIDQDWSIIQVKHNITETANNSHLGMFIDPSVTVTMNNDAKIQNDWYLLLNGKIDLQGKSQLVQTINSDLAPTSAGSLERDQQGQTNLFNYNYWSSPVGTINATTNNNGYTVNGVMRDGTDPLNPQNITWTTGYNGAPTTPITLSSYWIFKFQNTSPVYANWSSVGPNGALLAGQGFTLKGTGAATPTQNYTFVGKPNNGTIVSPIAANNLNLSGNPYASALDADQFLTANATSTTGALYFWQHYSTNSSHVLLQYQGGYATYTMAGGVPPVAPAGISTLGSSTRRPGRFIPVGQGFFINGSSTGGNITFDNSQRLFVKEDNASSNVMFRQPSGPRATNNPAYNNTEDAFETTAYTKVRLGFEAVNYHRETLLAFMNERAGSGIDAGYDAPHIDSQPNDMYFMNGDAKLIIDADGFFNENNVYPLGVKTAAAGIVKFVLDETENMDDNQSIYIHDNNDNSFHSIKEQAYEISIPAGTVNDRFSLVFKTNDTQLANNTFTTDESGIKAMYTSGDSMILIENYALDTEVTSVELYNILGQSISKWDVKNQDQSKIKIPVKNITSGTYIMKVLTSKGAISKKIIIK